MSAEDLGHGLRVRLLLQPLEAQLPQLAHLLVGLPTPVRRGLLFAQAGTYQLNSFEAIVKYAHQKITSDSPKK